MKKLIFALTCLSLGTIGIAQTQYKITAKIPVEGDGGWDYLIADEVNDRVFISHANIVQVLDVKTQKLIATIPDTKGVHGIALAPDLNKGFISNGKDSSVTVFDLKTLKTLVNVKVTGAKPDAILYDKFSQKVFVYNGKSANATVLDAKTDKVVATIKLDGKPEFSATDEKGKVYVNIEDKNQITVINASTLKVEANWPITPGDEPTGLAIDNNTHRLFSVCGNKLLVITDAVSGKVITTLPIGDGCDGVAFDKELKRIYASNGEGSITVVQEENENSFKVLETVATPKGTRTICVNSKTHQVFSPSAEFAVTSESTGEKAKGKPAAKPGSFVIIEVEPVKK
jgi:YVTN family beta-propeller protein